MISAEKRKTTLWVLTNIAYKKTKENRNKVKWDNFTIAIQLPMTLLLTSQDAIIPFLPYKHLENQYILKTDKQPFNT